MSSSSKFWNSRKQAKNSIAQVLLPKWDSCTWISWLTTTLTPLPLAAVTPVRTGSFQASTCHPSPGHTHTHTHTYTEIHTYTHTLYTEMHTYTHTPTQRSTHTHTHSLCKDAHTYIHTYTEMHTHTVSVLPSLSAFNPSRNKCSFLPDITLSSFQNLPRHLFFHETFLH